MLDNLELFQYVLMAFGVIFIYKSFIACLNYLMDAITDIKESIKSYLLMKREYNLQKREAKRQQKRDIERVVEKMKEVDPELFDDDSSEEYESF